MGDLGGPASKMKNHPASSSQPRKQKPGFPKRRLDSEKSVNMFFSSINSCRPVQAHRSAAPMSIWATESHLRQSPSFTHQQVPICDGEQKQAENDTSESERMKMLEENGTGVNTGNKLEVNRPKRER